MQKRAKPRALEVTAVIAATLSIAGCPPATGRTRGPLDGDGGACALRQLPVNGEACSSDGASCDFSVACERRPFDTNRAIQRCSCSAGRWRCSMLPCEQFLPDGGGLACPSAGSPLAQTFACDPRLEGRTCMIAPVQCSSGGRPQLPCTCDGTNWRCPDPGCAAPPPPPPPNLAGRVCTADAVCGSLRCNQSLARVGVCSNPCNLTLGPSAILTQCGHSQARCAPVRSTTLTEGFCTSSCTLGARSCASGFVCGQLHFGVTPSGITPACVPFCRSDTDCPVGVRCRVASGECSNRADAPTLLPSGAPCIDDPMQPSPCEGRCVLNSGGARVCAAMYNNRSCPTINGQPQIERRQGELTFCFGTMCGPFSPCCPAGSVCEFRSALGSFACGADTTMPNAPCNADAGVDASRSDASAPDVVTDGGAGDVLASDSARDALGD